MARSDTSLFSAGPILVSYGLLPNMWAAELTSQVKCSTAT